MKEEGSGRQVSEGSIHFLNNCDFFGSATTMNLCSMCYRDLNTKQASFSSHLKPQQLTLEKLNVKHPSILLPLTSVPSSSYTVMVEAAAATEMAMGTAPSSSAEQEVEKHEKEEEQTRKRKKRCFVCNMWMGLAGFKCRCGDLFCAQHRYFDMHDYSFNYKTAGRLVIIKGNHVMKAPKID